MTRLRCGRDLLAGDLTFPGAGRITILAPEPHPLRRQAGSSNDSSESSPTLNPEPLRAFLISNPLFFLSFVPTRVWKRLE